MFSSVALAAGAVAVIVLLRFEYRKRARNARQRTEEAAKEHIETVTKAILATRESKAPIWTLSSVEIKRRVGEASEAIKNGMEDNGRLPYHVVEVHLLIANAVRKYTAVAKKAYADVEDHDRTVQSLMEERGGTLDLAEVQQRNYLVQRKLYMEQRCSHLYEVAMKLGFPPHRHLRASQR